MNRPSNRVWASLALLSIIAPVGLLATFRLTGVLKEPSKPETITVETVTWNMSRPSNHVILQDHVQNSYVDDIISVDFDVIVVGYYEDEPDWPAWSGDYIKLRAVATANVSEGPIYSIMIRFSQTDAQGPLYIENDPVSMNLQNLVVSKTRWEGTDKLEAYFEAKGINQPQNSFLSIFGWWPFFDENNTNHSITITLEATCSNGQSYKKAIIPIRLAVLVD